MLFVVALLSTTSKAIILRRRPGQRDRVTRTCGRKAPRYSFNAQSVEPCVVPSKKMSSTCVTCPDVDSNVTLPPPTAFCYTRVTQTEDRVIVVSFELGVILRVPGCFPRLYTASGLYTKDCLQ